MTATLMIVSHRLVSPGLLDAQKNGHVQDGASVVYRR
jgi:hypothetical protein